MVEADLELPLSLQVDMAALLALAERTKPAMILFDPLISRIGGGVDTHKDAEVRQVLEPLAQVAIRTGSSVLGIIHLNKSTSQTNLLDRVMGSKAFGAMARLTLMVTRMDDNIRAVGVAKSNLGPDDGAAYTFQLLPTHVGQSPTNGQAIVSARVEWIGRSDQTVGDLMATSAEEAGGKSGVVAAGEYLRDLLAAGKMRAKDAKKQANGEGGWSFRTIERAAKDIGVEVIRTPTAPPIVYWQLPVPAGER